MLKVDTCTSTLVKKKVLCFFMPVNTRKFNLEGDKYSKKKVEYLFIICRVHVNSWVSSDHYGFTFDLVGGNSMSHTWTKCPLIVVAAK